jgi:hypothetical protein
MLFLALALLFPPHFWKIDDGVAWDITYNWVLSPVRYSGHYAHECQSATNYGGVEYALLLIQIIAVLVATATGYAAIGNGGGKRKVSPP